MKNILALIGVVVVLFAGVGWYYGWYKIGAEPTESGHRKFNVDINTKEIAGDLNKVKEKVGDIITNETKGTPAVPAIEKKDDGQSPGVHIGPNGNPVIVLPKLEIKTGN